MEAESPTVEDYRRAAALMTHRARADFLGVRAIVEEAAELGRVTRLLSAVDDGYTHLIHELRTERARALLAEFIESAAQHHTDVHIRRAAALINAMRRRDDTSWSALLDEANADPNGRSRVVADVADVYACALPELATPIGQEQLAKLTMQAEFAATQDEE